MRETGGQRWPNFYLVGAMKAGTTAIADALAAHPDVYLCPVKEPNFFCSDLYAYGLGRGAPDVATVKSAVQTGRTLHHAYLQNMGDYLALFSSWNRQPIAGECSTNYLYSAEAASNIQLAVPAAKILISLRNPTERAFSEFLMNCSIGLAKPPFSRWLDLEQKQLRAGVIPVEHRYVSAGLYFEQVRRYFSAFGRQQVKVVLFDDLQRNGSALMREIHDFLGVDARTTDHVAGNAASYPKFPMFNRWLQASGAKNIVRRLAPVAVKHRLKRHYYATRPAEMRLAETDRSRLNAAFAPDLAKVAELIERDLTAWQ